MTVGGPGQTSNPVALLISHLKISYRTGSVCCEKLACKCPQNSIKRSSSPAVTLATPHKKTCHHRSMRESERVTAFMECRLLSTPGNRTVLFFWHGAAHEEAPRCRCVASHVWWVCWMQLHFKDHRWLFFFFFFCSYSLRVDYREDLVGDCLTEMVGNAHHVYLKATTVDIFKDNWGYF